MLDYKILNYKPKFKKESDYEGTSNVQMLDLLTKTFNGNLEDVNENLTPILVNQYYVARPDLISKVIYGTDAYADVLCKLNGISNPFELNEDDLIYCPPLEYIQSFLTGIKRTGSDMIKDSDSIAVKSNKYQKQVSDRRSPNRQVEGDQNFIIDKSLGVVFY